jgi:putative transposon-encoded protein
MPRKVEFVTKTKLEVDGIVGFMRRKVARYGTGAMVICPKEFLGRTAYLVITREMWNEEEDADGAKGRNKKKMVGSR